METIILIFKGFLVGIGKIIPGVSGSLIAVSLNIYERMIDSIVNIFSDLKKNILFLAKISIGILLSLVLFSKVINYFLNLNYVYTMGIFIGLFLGVVPNILKKTKYNKKDLVINIILIFIVFLLTKINLSTSFILDTNFKYIYIIILGFIDALTMIIPGISGTAIFMLLDVYEFILNMYGSFIYIYLIFFIIGLIIGIIVTTKLVSYLIKKYNHLFYKIISYLTIYSLILLFINILNYLNINNILIFMILVLISFLISKKLDNM